MEFDTLKENIVRQFGGSTLIAASRLHGLGYTLGHIEHDSDKKPIFKIVHCGSKGLTPTQQRYSTIELECLAIIWAIQKCQSSRFTLTTDPWRAFFRRTSLA